MPGAQKVLEREQIDAFHHDGFVEDQVRHFTSMMPPNLHERLVVVDIGGGIGLFAKRLREVSGHDLRVLDLDSASVELCARIGVKCTVGDALNPIFAGDEQVVTFNMILHHLVGANERTTLGLQSRALLVWRPRARFIFVNEYVYESLVGDWAGRFIYLITRNKLLSWIGSAISRFVPSLRANTFGVGVRFRAREEWLRIFAAAGYAVTAYVPGESEPVTLAQRLLLIKSRGRDSFLLEPDSAAAPNERR